MAAAIDQNEKVPVQCEDISVQCQDDQFGLDAEVVYDDKSFPSQRCTPFVTGSYHRGRVPGQNQDTGVCPGFIAPDGMGGNSHELMNRDERCEKEKRVHPKGKKKKVKRGENTASPLKRKIIQSASDSNEM